VSQAAFLQDLRRRNIGGLLLACALVLAQTLLAVHALEHLAHLDEDQCEICLLGTPLGAALGSAMPALASLGTPNVAAIPSPVRRLVLQSCYSPHLARAPPVRP
jgi:hypothetical protein